MRHNRPLPFRTIAILPLAKGGAAEVVGRQENKFEHSAILRDEKLKV